MKKVIAILSCVALIMALNTGTCFAGEPGNGVAGENEVPAILNLAPTSIDFNISENIQLTGVANSVDLTCTKLKVENNLLAGAIQVTSLTASGNQDTGWSIVEYTTNFAALPLNKKQLGLKCEGIDLSTASYGPTAAIEPQKSLEISFEAKTGVTSEQVTDATVAKVVATVKMVDTKSTFPEVKEEE